MVLSNGVFLRSTTYDTKSHLDSADLQYLNKGKEGMTDLGIITPFVTAGYLVNPQLYTFGNFGKNRIYLDGHIFKYSHPIAEEPFYIVEDLSGNDRPGLAGESFKVKFKSKKYDNGYILAYDVHDPTQVLVTEDEIVKDGDGYIYTLRLKGADAGNKWFPKEFLTPGTIFFPITTVETEYSQLYSSVPEFSGGVREYFNHVGYTRAQLHYSVTRDAAKGKICHNAIMALDQATEVIEMFAFKNGTMGYDLNLQGQSPVPAYMNKYKVGQKEAVDQMRKDIVQTAWIPRIDAMAYATLETMIEAEAIFGSGGTMSWDGKGVYQTALGLFHQLNMGPTISYNIYDLTLAKFEYFIAKQLKDKVQPFTNKVTKIATGRGGYAWAKTQMRNLPSYNGQVWGAEPFVQGVNAKGNNQNLHYSTPDFVSYEMTNGYGTLLFELNPALDPVEANDKVNPMVPVANGIGGHRLSSYMFVITDILEQESDNVVELMYGPDWDFEKSVEVGKLPYMGQARMQGAYQRSSNHPGYKVMIEKRHKAYFVKDVTKSLLIKPLNPFTGRPIYSGFYK